MLWLRVIAPLLLAPLLIVPARAEEAAPGDQVAWSKDLPTAMARAKEDQKVLMICVNARHGAGRKTEEPAAKALREVIYRDTRVVKKSGEFVCVLIDAQGSASEFGELRALGIDGDIVSPQHIFLHPDGKKILVRVEYWGHGQGESAVQALLDMMAKAQERARGGGGGPAPDQGKGTDGEAPAAEGPDGPGAKERTEWIERMLQQVVTGEQTERAAALASLVQHDRDGDCTAPLIVLLTEQRKNTGLVVAIIRALGHDGLEIAALPIADHLGHRDDVIRGNAAVSLEYIGSREKKVVAALRKAAEREKDQSIANHMFRALGRCGSEDAKVRALLLKRADGAKSEYASFGPSIGLAYFAGDKKAAQGVEKILKKIGVPGSRRGGAQNTVKRGVLCWTLAAIGDKKSAKFMREELMPRLENVQAFWVEGLLTFYDNVARACEGDESAMAGIRIGIRAIVQFSVRGNLGRYGAETRSLMDEYRMGRDTSKFEPKGDKLLGDGNEG